jgi:NAD(P)-dependent dehydrogenase (short-subunit alcohol dehydrogenase family)
VTDVQRERRVAVVTGASHGVGRAIVVRLVLAGFTVWAIARDGGLLSSLALTQPPGSVLPLALDLTAPDDRLVARAVAAVTGSVAALVHAAGIIEPGPLLAAAGGAALAEQLRANTIAPLRLTSLLAPQLTTGGRVVFVNSTQGLHAEGEVGGYAASKHALRAVADSLREELAPDGIGVTSLYLGRTATPMQERLYAARQESYRPELLIQPESVADLVASVLALPQDVEVTDITLRPSVKSY